MRSPRSRDDIGSGAAWHDDGSYGKSRWFMFSPSSLRAHLAAMTSLPGLVPSGPRVLPGLRWWLVGIVLASCLTAWLSGLMWPGLMAGIIGMVLLSWRLVKMAGTLRDALARTERERVALEQALRTSQKMEALGRLTVGVAHDFNNHLTVISSNVELMSRHLDASQERLQRHAAAAMQAVQRAAGLTGRLLSFSRQPVREAEALDVNRMLGGLGTLLRGVLGDRGGLDIVLSKEPWFTWADVNQIESAVLSLVVNVHEQAPFGASLVITVSNLPLDQVSEAEPLSLLPGEYIQIALEASVATDPARRWQLADDLSSADLSMARAFMRENGGTILQSDSATDGLALRLLLPRHVPAAQFVTKAKRGAGERPTILVVEDDDLVRCSCVEILRELGYDVLEAADAMEGFRLITDHGGIDLLCTDLGLPGGVNGQALADAARNLDADMRMLFMTGYQQADIARYAQAALLRKPFAPSELVDRVRDLLTPDRAVGRPATV